MNRFAVSAVISAIGFSIAPFASLARADVRTTPALMCYAAAGTMVVDSQGRVTGHGGHVDLICPIATDNTTQFKHNNAGVVIEGFQTNAHDVTIKACVTWYNGGGGSCGAASSFAFGQESYSIPADDLSAWHAAGGNDFPYIAVHMNGGAENTFAGYVFSAY